MKLPFKRKSQTLPLYWEVMVGVWPAWDNREERRAEEREQNGQTRGRRHARNMPNFEGTWKMKSSLNFEELLKALGEFWDLLFKCLNKQIWRPLIYSWNANSDTFTDTNVIQDLQSQVSFLGRCQVLCRLCLTFECR